MVIKERLDQLLERLQELFLLLLLLRLRREAVSLAESALLVRQGEEDLGESDKAAQGGRGMAEQMLGCRNGREAHGKQQGWVLVKDH